MSNSVGQAALASLAEFCGGTAYLCDRQGQIIDGCPATAASQAVPAHLISRCVADTVASQETVKTITDSGISLVTIVLGAWVLVLDNRQRVEDKLKYQQIVEESLPFIAQVAGGTAVLFDHHGIRFRAVEPDGKQNPGAEGVFTHLSQRVMQELRPSLGPSTLRPGATAVRIPLTPDYGLAFNNTYAANQRQRLLDNARQYRYAHYHIEDIVGESPLISKAKKMASEVAKSPSTVLLTGETGTGKELFAQAIHNLSSRYNQPFVAINCGALPADLVESTLFGYAEGAFTGARKSGQAGAFEQANDGTLFLDEVSEMPFDLQVKLLRVLQEREVTRVGHSKPLKVDVRIIASTNKLLHELIKAGRFRADLFFRLNVFEIIIPPLRERRDDLIALTDFFLKKFSNMIGKSVQEITPAAMQALSLYSWPGNVRELQNCLEYAFNIVDVNSRSITPECLPARIRSYSSATEQELSLYAEQMNRTERELVVRALALCNGNKAEAARRLGINRTTLWRILKKYKLDSNAVAESNGVANTNT
jgi:DNA-binding NtrC family response regulator